MIIRIENENGFSVDIGSKQGLKLLEYPDFGNIKTNIVTDSIPGIKGELVRSVERGSRDIRLKIEAGIPMSEVARAFAEGTGVKLIVNGLRYINGIISGVSFSRPVRLSHPVMNVIIRCPFPYFKKVGGVVTVNFTNRGGGIYETGDYSCTRVALHNEGDVSCPVNISMASTADSSVLSGLLTHLDWNNGVPIYSGVIFKRLTEKGHRHFITTDISSERFFDSWNVMDNTEYFQLPPGDTVLFAQNVEGDISFEPLFLYADGGDE